MGFRFRRSVKLLPGIRINFGLRGISATVGPRGANINFGPRGTHLNLGVPGTGLGYRVRLDSPTSRPVPEPGHSLSPDTSPPQPAAPPPSAHVAPPAQVIEFKSVDVASLGSESLVRVAALLEKLQRQREDLDDEIRVAEKDLTKARAAATKLAWLRRRVAPAADAARAQHMQDSADRLEALKEIRASLVLDVDFAISDAAAKAFGRVVAAFDAVSRSQRVWDVASAQRVDRARTRSAASQTLNMERVDFNRTHDDVMANEFRPPLFVNDNGADMLLYPAFVAARRGSKFALMDIRTVEIATELVRFVVHDGDVPDDADVVGQTWQYVNKDGRPDRRFSYNPTIPIARYCKIYLRGAGLNEAWMVSKANAALAFGEAVARYQASVKGAEHETTGVAPPAVDEWPDPELPEKVEAPPSDWRTPLTLYGGLVAVAAVVLVGASFLAQPPAALPTTVSAPAATPPAAGAPAPTSPAPMMAPASPASSSAPSAPSKLTQAEIAEMQQLLRRAGFDPGPPDGKIGPKTRQALGEWGKQSGLADPKLDRMTLDNLRQRADGDRRYPSTLHRPQ